MIKSLTKKYPASVSSGRLSSRILTVLVLLAALVFGCFFLIGYDRGYDEDTGLAAPMLTDVLLWFIYLFLFLAVAVCAGSVVRGVCLFRSSVKDSGGVPSARIVYGIVALLAVSFPLTFMLGSPDAVLVNGVEFTDAFWLRISDMFIYTSLIFLVVAVAAVVYGMSGHARRRR